MIGTILVGGALVAGGIFAYTKAFPKTSNTAKINKLAAEMETVIERNTNAIEERIDAEITVIATVARNSVNRINSLLGSAGLHLDSELSADLNNAYAALTTAIDHITGAIHNDVAAAPASEPAPIVSDAAPTLTVNEAAQPA